VIQRLEAQNATPKPDDDAPGKAATTTGG